MIWRRPQESSSPPRATVLLFVSLWLFCLAVVDHRGAPLQDSNLEPGKPIERELAAGVEHSYQLNSAGNQFLHLVVNQRGIDVVVVVFSPDGKQVVEVDSPNGKDGPEPVLVVLEPAGVYQIKVRSLEKEAPAGRYTIKIHEVRAATQQDRELVADRITAQQTLDEAQVLIVENTATSLRAAITKLEQALALCRKTRDRYKEAFTHARLGFANDALGFKQQALDHFLSALPIFREVGDKRWEGIVLSNTGLVYSSWGEQRIALDYYAQTLEIKRVLGDKSEEAITLNNMGLAYVGLSELQKALDCYTSSLSLAREVGDRESQAVTLVNMGQVYQSLGEPQKALELYHQAQPLSRDIGDWMQEGIIFNSIGVIHDSLGDSKAALEHFSRALPILRKAGSPKHESLTLRNAGRVYASTNDTQKALDHYNQSLQLSRTSGDRQAEAVLLYLMGDVYQAALRDAEKALDHYRRSLALSKAIEDRQHQAPALLGIARVERDRGNLDAARAAMEDALTIVESLRINVMSQRLRTSFLASKQQYYDFYIDLLMRQHRLDPARGYDALALQASERARARTLIELLTESGSNIKEGADPALLERQLSLGRRLNFQTERQIRLLNSTPDPGEVSALKKEIDALIAEYREVEDQIRARSPRYAALAQPVPPTLVETRQLLDVDTVLLSYSLGEENSYLWVVTSTGAKSYVLPRRQEIEAVARRVYDLLMARNTRQRFETWDERNARVARADADYIKAARELSRMLLGQVSPSLLKKRLLVVSDGALQYVPFAALPLPSMAHAYRPLITQHEIVSLPSVLSLSLLRRDLAGREPAPKTLAVLADPVFEAEDVRVKIARKARAAVVQESFAASDLVRSIREVEGAAGTKITRLPFTRGEANEISVHIPASQRKLALDFAASRDTAMSAELSQYRYVHFATHGLINSVHPELSGIVFSLVDERGDAQDGFLRAYEIYNLKLPAELVVLSGCRTGLGKEIRGEGMVSLTRGFMYAGAARVLVSLWDVSDEASSELMSELYRGMHGRQRLRTSAALRMAQLRVMKQRRWQAPYYWAAFVLQGEPR